METTEAKKSELSTAETTPTENSGTYIGDFLAQDVFHFCNVKWPGEMPGNPKLQGVVAKIRSVASGKSFCWPGAFFPAAWLAYRGMIPHALVVLIATNIYFFISTKIIAYFISVHPAAYMFFLLIVIGIYICFMGMQTIKLYHRHVFTNLDQLGLRNRKNIPNTDLEEGLQQQGKPSVLRGILIPLTFHITATCIVDILFTIKNLFLLIR